MSGFGYTFVVRQSARTAIIEATLRLLGQGDARFAYERLASEAGVSRQTLYTHFPDRTALLIEAVEHARTMFGGPALAEPIYAAPTAREALAALVAYHVAFTPKILAPARAVEAQRAESPELSAAFERRPAGRRQLVRHVVTRLRAEGELDPAWTVDDAADWLSALTTASFTSDLLEERGWTLDQLADRLRLTVERALLVPTSTPTRRKERSR